MINTIRIEETGQEVKIGDIKTAEIISEYNELGDTFEFSSLDLNIDFHKNFKIDIFKNNSYDYVCSYTVYVLNKDYISPDVVDNEDGTFYTAGDIFDGYELILNRFGYSEWESTFLLFFARENLYDVNENDILIMKVTYIEANELTIPYYSEL